MRRRNLPHKTRNRLDIQLARIPSHNIRAQLEHRTPHGALFLLHFISRRVIGEIIKMQSLPNFSATKHLCRNPKTR